MSRYADSDDVAAAANALAADDAQGDIQATDVPEPDEPETGDEGEVGSEYEPSDDAGTTGDEQQSEGEPRPSDATFTVQVNGNAVEVTQDELIAGYQRLSDYTRKTQLLVAERQNLHSAAELLGAMERNPARTLQVLAKHYGVPLDGDDVEYEEPSREAIELHELKQWREQMEARQRETAVDAEVGRLHSLYGDFDDEHLFTFAVQNGVGHLETALRAMMFDQAGPNRNGKQVEKRKVAGQAVRSNGHSTAVATKTPPEKIGSFADAYAAAKRELDRT